MKKALNALALCLSTATLLPTTAMAALSSTQMDAAKLNALSGKVLNLPSSCPAVNIPSSPVKTKADFDKLETQLKRAQLCTISMREMAKPPNALQLAKTKYPNATPAQLEELADIMLLAARPVLEKQEAALSRNENESTEMALGFMRRTEIEQSIEEDFKQCDKEEPKERAWKSWVAADIFLTQYSIFDKCVKGLFSKIERMDPTYVVNTHYSKESYIVQTYLLNEIPHIQQAGLKALADRLDAAAPARERAKAFSIRDRTADVKASEK